MSQILFDSDVLIDLLRGNARVQEHIYQLVKTQKGLFYTPVSVAEIYRGLRSNERIKTREALGVFSCTELKEEVGQRAGEYLRMYAKSHGLEMPDALIAATAVLNKFSLCTFNWKHYPMSELHRYRMER